MSSDNQKVTVVGGLPPPVTGMTILTQRVVSNLQDKGTLRLFNWSPTTFHSGLKFRIARFIRMLYSVGWLVLQGRVQEQPMYLVANSKGGLYLTAILTWVAAKLGYHVFLHHHTYRYIDYYDWRMALVDRAMTNDSFHIVHCDKMVAEFQQQYASHRSFITLFPSAVSLDIGQPRTTPHTPFCLGHLSNLMPAKGVGLALDTFRRLHHSGCHVRLLLAGPFYTRSAQTIVENAVAEFGDLVEYIGPVHGDAKRQFFSTIDAFLFPTRYPNESWGIVLNEALSSGVPVISYDRGCISTVIGSNAGVIVDRNAEFTRPAAQTIQRWIEFTETYNEASRAAIEQANFLNSEGNRQLEDLVSRIYASPVSS